MPILTIVGYETGFSKISMVRILQEDLQLDLEESNKMTDALMSGNVISLELEDVDFAEGLAEELTQAGARIRLE